MSTPMGPQRVPTQMTASPDTSPTTTLRGRWLLVARVAWLAVVLLTVGIFVAGVPLRFAELQQICTASASVCDQQSQLTPDNVRELQSIGLSAGFWAAYNSVVSVVFAAVWWTVATIIFVRRSDDRMALLVSLFLVAFPLTFLPDTSGALTLAHPAWWLPIGVTKLFADVLAMLFFYLFPSGQFVPRWTRWLAVVWIALRVVDIFFADSLSASNSWLEVLDFLIFLSFVGSFVFAQVYRYRQVSSPVQRRQTKWVLFGTAAALIGMIVFFLPFTFDQSPGTTTISVFSLIQEAGGDAFMLLIPLSIGVAMLRSRLFDIDVLINRTLVYGTLTIMLALVYVGGVISLQYVFRAITGGTSQLAVVASTLVIAALFQPLRRRVQTTIDRRFYRKKYDAAQVLAAFGSRLRDEVDLDDLTEDVVAVVRETLQPEYVSIWLRPPEKNK